MVTGTVGRVAAGPDQASRKVRTPQGRVLDNVQAGRPDGKRYRKENTRRMRVKLKRWCKRPPAVR